jgi:hypothetical protein
LLLIHHRIMTCTQLVRKPQMLLLIHHRIMTCTQLVRKPQMLHISLHISHHHHKLNCKHIVMHHVMIWHISLHISHHHQITCKLNCKHIVMRQMNLCKCDWMCYKMAWVVVITGQPHLFTSKKDLLRYKWIALVYDFWAKEKWNYSCSCKFGTNHIFALIHHQHLQHLFRSFGLNSHCVQPLPHHLGRYYMTVVGCVVWSIWHFTCGIVCGLVDFVASRYMYGCQSVAAFGSCY